MNIYRAAILGWLMMHAAGFFDWRVRRPWYRTILSDWFGGISLSRGGAGG